MVKHTSAGLKSEVSTHPAHNGYPWGGNEIPTIRGDLRRLIHSIPQLPRAIRSQPRGGWLESLSAVFIALALFILDKPWSPSGWTYYDAGEKASPSIYGSFTPSSLQMCLIIALYISLALVGWLPVTGAVLFIIVSFIFDISFNVLHSQIVDLWVPGLGISVIIVIFLRRGWTSWAFIVAVVDVAVANGFRRAFAMFSMAPQPLVIVGGMIAAIVLGTLLNRIRVNKIKMHDESLAAAKRVRAEMVTTLHDTVATELSRIVIIADSLGEGDATIEVRNQARVLADSARNAMRQLRLLMDSDPHTRSSDTESPLSAIKTCQRMLGARNIRLETEVPNAIDNTGTIQTRELVATIIREGAVNILKYAPEGATATLSVEIGGEDGVMTISMVNPQVGEATKTEIRAGDDDVLHGGLGLRTLGQRVGKAGGNITYGPNGDGHLWLLVATVPSVGYSSEGLRGKNLRK